MPYFLSWLFPKSVIGVDFGTASIKLVEFSRRGSWVVLKNYSELASKHISGKNTSLPTTGLVISIDATALALRQMLAEANIKNRSAIFAIPDFYTFCTSFDIPAMPVKEMAGAIRYTAAQYITLPITEVTLDWKVVGTSAQGGSTVFVVAIPNQIIADYRLIAEKAGLDIIAVEAEAFSVVRALGDSKKLSQCIIDIGSQSSTMNFVHQGIIQKSYSSNFGGRGIIEILSKKCALSPEASEHTRDQEGLISAKPEIATILREYVGSFVREIQNSITSFSPTPDASMEVIITGGISQTPGLINEIEKQLQQPVRQLNCFHQIQYPRILQPTLEKMAPRFSVVVGTALYGVEI